MTEERGTAVRATASISMPAAASANASASAPGPAFAAARVRQGPADLTLDFVNEAAVRQIATLGREPDWLFADRQEALRAFEALPIEANQLYTPYVDLRNAQLAGVRPYLEPQRRPLAEGTDAKLLPEGAAAYVELTEDRLASLVLSPEAASAGVVLETLGGLLERDPELLRRLLAESPLPNDKLAALSRAAWTQGLVVRVPSGVRLREPISIRWAMGAPGTALVTRTLISIGEDAEVAIVEEQTESLASAPSARDVPEPASPAQAFFGGTTEIRVGQGSNLAFAGLQNFPANQVAFQQRAAVVGQGATLRWALAQLGSRVVRSRIDNRLEGNGGTVEQAEIVFALADQLFDLTSYTRHVGRDTTGNLLSKGALADRSRAYMKGLITIEKSAHGTDSFLGEFGMNLSKQARSVAIPSLEIDQPDCRRAAHSSSVGPIDETQLFYLESRGIPPDEARKFIVLGYLEPVVARVPLASAQERLRMLLEAKWAARGVVGPRAAASRRAPAA